MKYIAGIFILWSIMYILSFTKYNFRKKNKWAGIGGILLIILIIILPIIAMFSK